MQKFNSKMIIEALQGFDKVIPKRHVLPECEYLKIDSKGFTATDLETTIYRPFPGLPECLVPFREFYDAMNAIQGLCEIQVRDAVIQYESYIPEITVDSEGNEIAPYIPQVMTITGNGKTFKVPVSNTDDYPETPTFEPEYKTIIPDLSRFIPFTSKDELKPAMNGVYIGSDIAGTDAHRLITCKNPVFNPENPSFILRGNVAKWIKQDTTIEYNSEKGCLYLPLRGKLYFNLIQDKYPEFANVIPQNQPYTVYMLRDALIKTLTEAMKSACQTTFQVRFSFDSDFRELKITAINIDYAKEYNNSIPCKFKDNHTPDSGFEYGMNAKFLIESLKTISDKVIGIQFKDASRAMTIQPSNGDVILNMPVMLNHYA